ncbi:hypothetical protein [Rhizobium metallidurans]|uniref:Uncharacterized protein n=1 Tax=Rhizobium metallidurans TaxID=1265931 RepID=A0A7W6CVZ3_9HYPH|nr:hypothetical protein [Rhizobium metallidurans]MBB3965932.1 hypothetical protein [Rhizobium metallidurans]
MTLREQLITVSDIFAQARGIGRQRLSTIVLNRGSTLDRIADGDSDLTTGTFEKAMLYFSDNWPEGADWPASVPRPVAEEAA